MKNFKPKAKFQSFKQFLKGLNHYSTPKAEYELLVSGWVKKLCIKHNLKPQDFDGWLFKFNELLQLLEFFLNVKTLNNVFLSNLLDFEEKQFNLHSKRYYIPFSSGINKRMYFIGSFIKKPLRLYNYLNTHSKKCGFFKVNSK